MLYRLFLSLENTDRCGSSCQIPVEERKAVISMCAILNAKGRETSAVIRARGPYIQYSQYCACLGVPLPPGIYLRLPHVTFQTRPSPFQNVHPPQLSHVNVNRVRGRTGNEAKLPAYTSEILFFTPDGSLMIVEFSYLL